MAEDRVDWSRRTRRGRGRRFRRASSARARRQVAAVAGFPASSAGACGPSGSVITISAGRAVAGSGRVISTPPSSVSSADVRACGGDGGADWCTLRADRPTGRRRRSDESLVIMVKQPAARDRGPSSARTSAAASSQAGASDRAGSADHLALDQGAPALPRRSARGDGTAGLPAQVESMTRPRRRGRAGSGRVRSPASGWTTIAAGYRPTRALTRRPARRRSPATTTNSAGADRPRV